MGVKWVSWVGKDCVRAIVFFADGRSRNKDRHDLSVLF